MSISRQKVVSLYMLLRSGGLFYKRKEENDERMPRRETWMSKWPVLVSEQPRGHKSDLEVTV